MLSSSPSKIHDPRVTGVSPRPTTSDSARNCETRGWDPVDADWSRKAVVAAPTLVDHTRPAHVIYPCREVIAAGVVLRAHQAVLGDGLGVRANAPPASHLSLIRSQ